MRTQSHCFRMNTFIRFLLIPYNRTSNSTLFCVVAQLHDERYNPCCSRYSAIPSWITGLAICRQFHVSKKSTWCKVAIAMCRASSIALAGMSRWLISASARAIISSVTISRSSPSSAASLLSAASGLPAEHSCKTDWETKRSYSKRFSHQDWVSCWWAAQRIVSLGQAVR